MTVKIRREAKVPTVDDLENSQLGWSTTEKKLTLTRQYQQLLKLH
jgi:hypothetical protein